MQHDFKSPNSANFQGEGPLPSAKVNYVGNGKAKDCQRKTVRLCKRLGELLGGTYLKCVSVGGRGIDELSLSKCIVITRKGTGFNSGGRSLLRGANAQENLELVGSQGWGEGLGAKKRTLDSSSHKGKHGKARDSTEKNPLGRTHEKMPWRKEFFNCRRVRDDRNKC